MAAPTPGPLGVLGRNGDYVLAGSVIALVGILMVPLHPMLLDVLLATSLSIALLLFLAALYTKDPVDFSAFPTLLLVTTVFRLALNVASTRLILMGGADGSAAAGKIIQAFGQYAVGGDYLVGLVVFTILVVINFVVITKGAGRVAEVAARFTLDALPGKQMAIDAELNAGLIDERTARRRREAVAREADFYGAMDGASKFVRGDAIASIIITLVNAVGGIAVGTVVHQMAVSDALSTYVVLTIGDGLVGQVPALVVSIAAGILVTRVDDARGRSLHSQVGAQVLENPRVLAVVAVTLGMVALVPGLRATFIPFAAAFGWFAWQRARHPVEHSPEEPEEVPVEAEPGPRDLLPVEPLAIEVAVDLVYLVDERQGGELLQRIHRIRSQFAQELGVVLPPVSLRDNLRLPNGTYVVQMRGEEIGRGRVFPRQQLALDPGSAKGPLKGVPTTDPVFGLPAFWILGSSVLEAQRLQYTVVDVPTVLTTHLVELMHVHGHEVYDGAQLDELLERVRGMDAKLVEELVPDALSRQTVLKVVRNLIREGVSVRDAQSILEALAEYAGRTTDADVLTEFVRQRLSRHITGSYADDDGVLHCVQLGARTQGALLRALTAPEGGGAPTLNLDPDIARKLIVGLRVQVEQYAGPGQAVVLAPPLARGALRRLLERVVPRLPVLSSGELLPQVRLDSVGTVEVLQGG